MDIKPINQPIDDYCRAMDRDEIDVNRDYQRSDRVWPLPARQFLIETILLDLPIPKLSLHQVTDLKLNTSRRSVVDGQQRTRAIHDYFGGQMRMARNSSITDAAGKTLAELPELYHTRFLQYVLAIDLLQNALPSEVRDVFRRINAYTVPLNPEESRHALFQGPFKWFIYRLAGSFSDAFAAAGIFTEKQLVRMQDTKLLAEITHAVLNGVETTSKAKLDRLYKDHDETFEEQGALDAAIRSAMGHVISFHELYRSELMKPYEVYALILALMHFEQPLAELAEAIPPREHGTLDRDAAVDRLAILDEALSESRTTGPLAGFVRASSSRTNVADQRLSRIRTIYQALLGDLEDAA